MSTYLNTDLIIFRFSTKNDYLSIKNCRASEICFGLRAESKVNAFYVVVLKLIISMAIWYGMTHMVWYDYMIRTI